MIILFTLENGMRKNYELYAVKIPDGSQVLSRLTNLARTRCESSKKKQHEPRANKARTQREFGTNSARSEHKPRDYTK